MAAAATSAVPVATASAAQSVGTFRAGSGNFLTTSGTDGLRQVGGALTFTQSAAGQPITVSGNLTGLAPLNLYVAVPYKDGVCIPVRRHGVPVRHLLHRRGRPSGRQERHGQPGGDQPGGQLQRERDPFGFGASGGHHRCRAARHSGGNPDGAQRSAARSVRPGAFSHPVS